MKKETKEEPMIKVHQLRPPKLKDKGGRSRIVINVRQSFGFMPEILIIDKVIGTSNQIIISAVLPKEMLEGNEDGANKPNKRGRLPSGSSKDNSGDNDNKK